MLHDRQFVEYFAFVHLYHALVDFLPSPFCGHMAGLPRFLVITNNVIATTYLTPDMSSIIGELHRKDAVFTWTVIFN
jgi:hypothetical protein